MRPIVRLLSLASVLVLSGCSVGLDASECASDVDCEAPQVCVAGACVAPTSGDGGVDATPDAGDAGPDVDDDTAGDASDAGDTSGPAPDCTTYCALITDTCDGEDAQYPSAETCIAFCEGYGWPAGSTDVDDANTIGCRIAHTRYAAASENDGDLAQVTSHCRHAGPTGGNRCGT